MTMDAGQPIPVLVAEDERASRARLRQLLARHADVALVAECATGLETAAAIESTRPAAVFLDIQMPGLGGFDVLDRLASPRPAVVFVTAYGEHAIRAFDVRAVDYLLKPFDDERFDRALAAVRRELGARGQAVPVAPQVRAAEAGVCGRLAVRDGSALVFLETVAISHITAEDCYSRIHLQARTLLVREPLAGLSRRLASPSFCRIHRSTIVNLHAVELIEPLTHGDLRLTLIGGSMLRVSRRYRMALDVRLHRRVRSP